MNVAPCTLRLRTRRSIQRKSQGRRQPQATHHSWPASAAGEEDPVEVLGIERRLRLSETCGRSRGCRSRTPRSGAKALVQLIDARPKSPVEAPCPSALAVLLTQHGPDSRRLEATRCCVSHEIRDSGYRVVRPAVDQWLDPCLVEAVSLSSSTTVTSRRRSASNVSVSLRPIWLVSVRKCWVHVSPPRRCRKSSSAVASSCRWSDACSTRKRAHARSRPRLVLSANSAGAFLYWGPASRRFTSAASTNESPPVTRHHCVRRDRRRSPSDGGIPLVSDSEGAVGKLRAISLSRISVSESRGRRWATDINSADAVEIVEILRARFFYTLKT
jgi:hypothetical protein